ncbi:MAG TPA: polysaccharide biosynthesis/export family protein [Bacteroidales bacterium]|nr:polysaccharide biosynthesis/export family protein [Bacteroidales bacterium]
MRDKNSILSYGVVYKDHVLRPYDEVYIQISGLGEEASNVIPNNSSGVGSMSATGANLSSQMIDKEGFLTIPIVGKVMAKDKTIEELEVILKESLVNILNQPIVEVKLVNKRFSVVGEVSTPGNFSYSQERLTIFDALGMAGDITKYGNRKKVILVRNENNINTITEINLLKADILASEFYYLRPGDILYVKPLRSKAYGITEFPYGLILSLLSTTLIFLNFANGN